MILDFLTHIEKKLVESGYSSLTLQEQNALAQLLANRDKLKYTDITEDYILNYHKKVKTEILSEKCDETILKGFVSTNGDTYRTNRDDQLNMIGKMVEAIHDNSVTQILWKTENRGYRMHTLDEWINQVFLEGIRHKENTLYRYDMLKQKLHQAETEEEILAVEWK